MKIKALTFTSLPFLALALLIAFSAPTTSQAQSIVLNSDETRVFEDFNWLPYAFFSGSFGLGFGVGGAYSGWHEEQTSLLGAITLGTKGSYNLILSASDLRVPGFQRIYFQPLFVLGRYQDQFLYIGQNNPGYQGQRAGANDSDPDNYITAIQNDNRADLQFRYLLPIGNGEDSDNIINRYVLENGFLRSGETGGSSWNPLTSGRSYLYVTPQWRQQTLEREGLKLPLETWNVELALERDNREFPYNATRGSYQKIAYKKDFYEDDILDNWDFWSFDYSKLINLGRSRLFKQQVLALNWWTGYVPSWETEEENGQTTITGRPPQYDGAILGGINRMRAYEDSRFQDKAAIYYSLEYRFVPQWQPQNSVHLLDWADIQYIQWVLYTELGQVSPHWNIQDLHDDLHSDVGFGLRGMIHKAVCRLDFSFGEEGTRVVAMYGQPF